MCINLNFIFGYGTKIHPAIPCSQCNTVHCKFCPSTAQLCRVGSMSLICGEYSGCTRAYAILSFLCALIQWTCPIQLICMSVPCGFTVEVWQGHYHLLVRYSLCTRCSSLTPETPFIGAVGCPEALLEVMPQPGFPKDPGQMVESH